MRETEDVPKGTSSVFVYLATPGTIIYNNKSL